MINANHLLIDKLKNHTNIGLRVKIHKPKTKLITFKRVNLNIQVLNFHSSILNKYKMLGNYFLEQNFRFLQFIAPERKGDVLYIKKDKIKYINKEKIKKIVETIYQDKEKLVEDFRLKELISQRAELIYNEQKLNDTKEIKEVLEKELDKFSKGIATSELDDRIVLYTKLNNYLNTININQKNTEYKFDRSVYLNYNSQDIKSIIKQFDSIENTEYKKVNEYIQNIENIIKPLGVSIKKEQLVVNQKTINNILNIKNINTINELAPIFTKSFENTILKTSENIWQVLNENITNVEINEITNVIEKINKTLEVQLKTLFKNVSFSNEYKNIFTNEIKTIFLNSDYTIDTKVFEVNNTINNYIENIVVQNQSKQGFAQESKQVLEEKVYKQTLQKITSLGINLHFILKNDLRAIIKKSISKTTTIDTIQKYNFVVNEVIEQFLQKEKNSIVNNTSILKKYTNKNTSVLNSATIDTPTNLIKLGNNVSLNNNIEQRAEQIFENIVKEIKTISSFKQIKELEKLEAIKGIEEIIKTGDIKLVSGQYTNLIKQFTNKIEVKASVNKTIQEFVKNNIKNQELIKPELYKSVQVVLEKNLSVNEIKRIDKKILLEKITNLSKLTSPIEVNKAYELLVKEYLYKQDVAINIKNVIEKNIIKEQISVENVYKNIVNEISSANKYLNITNKSELLKKVTKLTKLSSVTQVSKEYQNIINEYKVDTINSREIQSSIFNFTKLGDNVSRTNIIEQRVELLYENILKEIKVKEPLKQITIKEKNKILQNIQRVVKHGNTELINKEYKTILKQFVKNVEHKTILEDKSINIDTMYENVISEINTNTTNKYINVVNKNEILKKITNLTKLSNITKVNKEYQNILNEYKVDSRNSMGNDIVNMTKLGDNISLLSNYEQKMEGIYQNIVKEIKKTKPLKHINNIEKSQLLQKIDKLVKLDSSAKVDKEYKNIIEQFVSKTKTKQSTRENIINKLISASGAKEIKNIQNNIKTVEHTNTLIKNTHKTNVEVDEDDTLVYISGRELKKQKKEKHEIQVHDVDNKLNEKEYQFTMNIQNIYKNFDENLDEIALKIFRDIKDELSMQYKRI